jgi:hypothetical protein
MLKTTFLLNGISSLLSWNAVLAAFDYFGGVYPKFSVSNYFPIPLFVAYLIVGVLFHRLQYRFSYRTMIIMGLLLTNLSIILMLGVSILWPESVIGFVLCMAMCFVGGLGGNLAQLSFYAIINYLSSEVVAVFTVGSAVSMLIISSIRMVVLFTMGSASSNVTAIAVYFGVSLALSSLDLALNIKFFKSAVYK